MVLIALIGATVHNGYQDEERRQHEYRLPDYIFKALVEAAAQRGKELAKQEIYAEIGKGFTKRILWVFGLGGAAVAFGPGPFDHFRQWLAKLFS